MLCEISRSYIVGLVYVNFYYYNVLFLRVILWFVGVGYIVVVEFVINGVRIGVDFCQDIRIWVFVWVVLVVGCIGIVFVVFIIKKFVQGFFQVSCFGFFLVLSFFCFVVGFCFGMFVGFFLFVFLVFFGFLFFMFVVFFFWMVILLLFVVMILCLGFGLGLDLVGGGGVVFF